MMLPIILIFLIAIFIFVIIPQLARFRQTTGIVDMLAAGKLTAMQKIWLMLLGLKTPFVNTLAMLFSFLLAEGDSLRGFNWEQFISHEHAVWVTTGLWAIGLWTHFSGINAAAAMTPVAAPSATPEA